MSAQPPKFSLRSLLPGLGLVALVSAIAWFAAGWINQFFPMEPVVLGVLLGLAVGLFQLPRPALKPGVDFAARSILEAGVVLLGFKLDFRHLLELGPWALVGVVVLVPLVVLAGIALGRAFRLSPKLAVLIGVGSGICGSSAIAAVAPCIEAEEKDSVLAIGGLSVLGALAVIAYTALSYVVPLSDIQFGVWSGLSMQAVANAIAAAFARGDTAGEIGTLVKMARVALLAPLSLLLAWRFTPRDVQHLDARGRLKLRMSGIPVYVLLFIAAAIVGSSGLVPEAALKWLGLGSAILIASAMAALGLSVDARALKNNAGPAILVSTLLFVFVALISYAWAVLAA
ncbi:putative sulfate exporter family transporter [bacterium]|nr:putative sulfate exporter family transporter [bacterium]